MLILTTNKNHYLSSFETGPHLQMVFCWWAALEKSRMETESLFACLFVFVAWEEMDLIKYEVIIFTVWSRKLNQSINLYFQMKIYTLKMFYI